MPWTWAAPAVVAGQGLLAWPRRPRGQVDAAWTALRSGIAPPFPLEESLQRALAGLGTILPARDLRFYAARRAGEPLELVAARQGGGAGSVGVAPVVDERAPLPPPEGLSCREESLDGLSVVSLGLGPKLLVRLALPQGRGLRRRERDALLAFSERLAPLADVLVALDATTCAQRAAETELRDLRLTSEYALRTDRLLGLLARLGGEALGAVEGYCAVWEGERVYPLWSLGDGEALWDALDPRGLPTVAAGLWLTPELPGAVAGLGHHGFALVSLRDADGGAAAAFGLPAEPSRDGLERLVLTSLSESLWRAAESHRRRVGLGVSYLETVQTAASLIEASGGAPRDHVQRVTEVSVALGRGLGLSSTQQADLALAARLHDLGMLAVPLGLPMAPGPLGDAERRIVEQHVVVGAAMLAALPEDLVSADVVRAVRHHHERWDGQGYPDGPAGQDIDVLGRILACAEVFVARTSPRAYRPRLSLDRALGGLEGLAGSQLDPDIVRLLTAIYDGRGMAAAWTQEA